MLEKFIDKKFRPDTLDTITWVNRALEDYRAQGYRASLRQVFYYGVARNLHANTEEAYSRLGSIVTDGRMAGYIDWSLIIDRNRTMDDHRYWESAAELMEEAAEGFRTNKWLDQPNYVECFIEKAALEGVLQPVCRKFEIPFLSCRGFSSASITYEAGKRLQERFHAGKQIHIIALFDHDPSGLAMTDDLENRLNLFAQVPVNVHRVALNIDQVRRFRLPENPVKSRDSRSSGYEAKFGDLCWELDALPLEELVRLVTDTVTAFRDQKLWDASFERQEEEREHIVSTLENLPRS